MNRKIQSQIKKLQALLDTVTEDTLEQLRDESLLLADHIEEYVYQRDAQRLVEEFIEESKHPVDDV